MSWHEQKYGVKEGCRYFHSDSWICADGDGACVGIEFISTGYEITITCFGGIQESNVIITDISYPATKKCNLSRATFSDYNGSKNWQDYQEYITKYALWCADKICALFCEEVEK